MFGGRDRTEDPRRAPRGVSCASVCRGSIAVTCRRFARLAPPGTRYALPTGMRHVLPFLACAWVIGCGGNNNGASVTNARAEALAYARDDIPCKTDTDCCTVTDMCLNQVYVVSAANQATVQQLITEADRTTVCNMCIYPNVAVGCGPAGVCVGRVDNCAVSGANFCGSTMRAGCTSQPASVKPKSPGEHVQVVLGCGT